MITTSNINCNTEPSGNLIDIDVKYADNITIPTLIKLLTIKIVARTWFGLLINLTKSEYDSFFSISSISWEFKEKNATSVPDIKAEKKIKITIIKNTINECKFKKLNSTTENKDNIQTK